MRRRAFLIRTGAVLGAIGYRMCPAPPWAGKASASGRVEGEAVQGTRRTRHHDGAIALFLCGDVMTGRGIDQVLPHPSEPTLHEPYMSSALGYVRLAERANGPIPRPVQFAYVWGEALDELERVGPDVRVINLETSVTRSDDAQPKGINYRMHPANIPCITAAGIDCCVLANNHILDWGRAGLEETLDTLGRAGLASAGAGRDLAQAAAPAVLEVPARGRVLVFAFGSTTSGIPEDWAATADTSGVNLLHDLSPQTVRNIAGDVKPVKRAGDIVVASIHWGGNWGYGISPQQTRFARALVDEAGVDVVHGHSSHHVKGIEVYRDRPILYGCGDLLTDYEGIGGYEQFRGDLGLMYFPTLDPSTGRLVRFEATPTCVRRFRLHWASDEEASWLCNVLQRESAPFGVRAVLDDDRTLHLSWEARDG